MIRRRRPRRGDRIRKAKARPALGRLNADRERLRQEGRYHGDVFIDRGDGMKRLGFLTENPVLQFDEIGRAATVTGDFIGKFTLEFDLTPEQRSMIERIMADDREQYRRRVLGIHQDEDDKEKPQ